MIPLNTIYVLSNAIALVGWVMLLASVFMGVKVPRTAARIIPATLAVIYTALMINILPFSGGGFGSIAALSDLFAQPQIALVGWIHYLAFDLFIGAWQVQTAKRQQLPSSLVIPSLLLTLLLGPLGLLVFLCGRHIVQGRQDALQASLDSSNN